MELQEESFGKDEYDVIIIGGGPATLAFFTYIISNNLLDQFMQLDVLVIERGTNFGSGKLGKYGIFSNTPASDFFRFLFTKSDEKNPNLQYLSHSTKNTNNISSIFEKITKCNITKCLKKYGHQKAPLPLIGLFFLCIGNAILAYIHEKYKKKIFKFETDVTEIQIINRNNQMKSRNYIPKQNNYEISALKNNKIIKIKSKVLILSNGNKLKISKKLLDKYKSFNTDKVYHSDYFLQEEGYKSIIRTIKSKEGVCKISILGGSHSAYSSAWLLLNQPSKYKLSKNNPYIAKFDRNCEICLDLPKCLCYGEVKDLNWDCEDSNVNLQHENTPPNMEIKILYRDHNKTFLFYNSEKVDLVGKEKWVKMIQCENFKEQKKHLYDADIILYAFGYASLPIPFYEINSDNERNKIKFAFDKKNKEFEIDNNLHLMDRDRNSFLSLFGLGHGYTSHSHLNFKGNTSNNHIRYSFYYFQSCISKKLYSEMFDLFSAKLIMFKIIKFQEYNSLKYVEKENLGKKLKQKRYNSNGNKSSTRTAKCNIIKSKKQESNEDKYKFILPDIYMNNRNNRFKANNSTDIINQRTNISISERKINEKSGNKIEFMTDKSKRNIKTSIISISKEKKKKIIQIKIKKPIGKNLKTKGSKIFDLSINKYPIWFQPYTNKIFKFDYVACNWLSEEYTINNDIKFPFNYAFAELPGESLLITGGESDNNSVSETFFYKERILTKRANMIVPRKNHSIIFSQNFCYVFGGFNNDTILNTCEKYDVRNDKWYTINSMKFPRANCSTLLRDFNSIYIIGGICDVDCAELFSMNQIELYDIALDKFDFLSLKLPFLINSSFVCYYDKESFLITGGKLKDKIINESVFLNVIDGSLKNNNLRINGWSRMFPVYYNEGYLHFFYYNSDTLDFPLYQKYFIESGLC